jgi:hypothetical protein
MTLMLKAVTESDQADEGGHGCRIRRSADLSHGAAVTGIKSSIDKSELAVAVVPSSVDGRQDAVAEIPSVIDEGQLAALIVNRVVDASQLPAVVVPGVVDSRQFAVGKIQCAGAASQGQIQADQFFDDSGVIGATSLSPHSVTAQEHDSNQNNFFH